jgi:hypothetical protein
VIPLTPLPMTAMFRLVMCPPSRPPAAPFQASGLLFAATRGPDWRPGRFLAAEQVSQRLLQVRVAEPVADRGQPLRPDVLAGLGAFLGPSSPSSSRGPNPGTGSNAGRHSTLASVLV